MRTSCNHRRATAWTIAGLVGLLGGCTSDEWPIDLDDTDESTDASSDPDPSLEGAALEVFEPESAGVYFLGEPLPLIARSPTRTATRPASMR